MKRLTGVTEEERVMSKQEAQEENILLTPSILEHFYLEICVQLDHFTDIRKDLWRSED
ncbi:hypothetical protein E2C01_099735 [Portunus trituberculatus]|uniref:Uncharacterized protein n=1 Tax=Portunus trituberculatus TaxID=210409 RepID=A0A5B7KB71_PORTR|nr:hypothetical protein [Portunus trituberculatus]